MTVHLDTSVLVDSLTDPARSRWLGQAVDRGDRLAISSIALFEWWRGPRTPEQLAVTDALFPDSAVIAFDATAARVAAGLYTSVKRARPRQADIAIAACAIEHGASLWTLNPSDFEDIPGLALYRV